MLTAAIFASFRPCWRTPPALPYHARMNKWSVCILLVGLAACGDRGNKNPIAESTEGRRYIGTLHRDSLPSGVERKGWIYLDSIGGHDYAITPVAEGPRKMFWLDESDSVAGWKVVQVLAFDSLPHGYELSLGKCTGHELQPAELAALVHRDRSSGGTEVVKAWHVNRANKSFDEIRAAGVVCP